MAFVEPAYQSTNIYMGPEAYKYIDLEDNPHELAKRWAYRRTRRAAKDLLDALEISSPVPHHEELQQLVNRILTLVPVYSEADEREDDRRRERRKDEEADEAYYRKYPEHRDFFENS